MTKQGRGENWWSDHYRRPFIKGEQKYRSLACLYRRKLFPACASAPAHQKHFLLTIPLIWQLLAIIKTWQMVSQRLWEGPASTAARDTAARRDRLSSETPFCAWNRRLGCLLGCRKVTNSIADDLRQFWESSGDSSDQSEVRDCVWCHPHSSLVKLRHHLWQL